MKKVSYAKLWHLLIERGILNPNRLANIKLLNARTLASIKNNEPVHLKVLLKLCEFLDCELMDIIEIIDVDNEESDK